MIRKLLLAVAIAVPVATFAGHGALTGGVAHAAGIVSQPVGGEYGCYNGSYTPGSSGPFYLYDCLVGEYDGTGPDTDDNSGVQNEVGTQSYSGLGCVAASITNGIAYYNPSGWVEFDGYNPNTDTYSVQARCTVHTGDTGVTHNLLAYMRESECDLQLFGDYSLYGSYVQGNVGPSYYGPSQLFETETPNGVVTLYCNATLYPEP